MKKIIGGAAVVIATATCCFVVNKINNETKQHKDIIYDILMIEITIKSKMNLDDDYASDELTRLHNQLTSVVEQPRKSLKEFKLKKQQLLWLLEQYIALSQRVDESLA